MTKLSPAEKVRRSRRISETRRARELASQAEQLGRLARARQSREVAAHAASLVHEAQNIVVAFPGNGDAIEINTHTDDPRSK